MLKPGTATEDAAPAEFPLPGAVEVTEYDNLGFREKAPGKPFCFPCAVEPAENDVPGALWGPETMQKAADIFVADILAAHHRLEQKTHFAG